MACKLKRLKHPPPHFSAASGASVTLGAGGSAAVLASVVYDGQAVHAPWTFTVKPGRTVLVVVVANQPGELTQIQEVCNGSHKVLEEFVFGDGDASVFVIQGVEA